MQNRIQNNFAYRVQMGGCFTVLNEDVKRFSLRKEVFIIICRYHSATQPFSLQKE